MAELANELVLSFNQGLQVDRYGLDLNPPKCVMARPPEKLTSVQLRFRWNATDIDARTAQRAAFDHHDPGATLAGGDRRGESTTTRADDGQVNPLG
jgi:hypothetical protein